MHITLDWKNQMQFSASNGAHEAPMDARAPIGQNQAMTPKELVAAGLGGCTAMDVIALFKKHKQNPQSFQVKVEIETSTGVQPAVFTKADIIYIATGEVSADVFKQAVTLSQTKYCGVSAMLAKSLPIYYEAILNGESILKGQAHFS